MSAILNSSTASISMDFSDFTIADVPAPGAVEVQALQFLPASSGGRKITGTIQVNLGGGHTSSGTVTVTIRDLAYDEFGLYGERLNPDERRKLVTKF